MVHTKNSSSHSTVVSVRFILTSQLSWQGNEAGRAVNNKIPRITLKHLGIILIPITTCSAIPIRFYIQSKILQHNILSLCVISSHSGSYIPLQNMPIPSIMTTFMKRQTCRALFSVRLYCTHPTALFALIAGQTIDCSCLHSMYICVTGAFIQGPCQTVLPLPLYLDSCITLTLGWTSLLWWNWTVATISLFWTLVWTNLAVSLYILQPGEFSR